MNKLSALHALTLLAASLTSPADLGRVSGDAYAAPPQVTTPSERAELLEGLVGAWLTHGVQEVSPPDMKLMIGGQSLHIGAQEGVLTAPLHRAPLLNALLSLYDEPPPEVAHSLSLSPLAKHIGLPLFDHTSSPKTSAYFPHLSREAARWLERLAQDEQLKVFGVPLRALVVSLYQRQLTQLAVAYRYLQERGRLDFERAAYELAMTDLYFKGPAYLKMRFSHIETGYATERSPDYVAFGFWLRREIDGSGPVLWRALKRLLPSIDPELPRQLSALSFAEAPRPSFDGPISAQGLTLFYQELSSQLQAQRPPSQAAGLTPFQGSALKALDLGRLLTALPSLSGARAGLTVDLKALERRLPYPLLLPRGEEEKGARPFSYYNPRFILWAADQLIPPSDFTVQGLSAPELYQTLLKPTVDSLARAYELLHRDQATLREERFEYMMSLVSKSDPAERLKRRFKAELSALKTAPLIQAEESLAFWIQREIDGSAPILWGALKLIMRRLDPKPAPAGEAKPSPL